MQPEPAITSADDPREFAATVSAMYVAALSGGMLPAHPRSVISESWARAVDAGVDPSTAPTTIRSVSPWCSSVVPSPAWRTASTPSSAG